MSLGKKIKELRIKKGMTQDELGDLIGKTRANVSSYENDVNTPPVEVLTKIADHFRVSIDYLLDRVPDPLQVVQREDNLSEEETMLLRSFLLRSEEMLREKGGNLSEDKLQEILRFMGYTFFEDLERVKNKK
jgi:transcriptional regulator with XRE-family HTH domain